MPLIRDNGLVYNGDTSFSETDEAQGVRDDYGLDELTRVFVGRNSLLQEFLRRYPAGTPDTEFYNAPGRPPRNPGMAVVGVPSFNIGRAFSTVAFRLTGKLGTTPAEPLVRIVDGTHEDTVQVYAIIGEGAATAQVTLDYRAPSTTYEYWTQNRPDGPRYFDGALQLGEIKVIRKRGIAKFNGTDFGPLNTFCAVEQRMGEFQRSQEGKWWHCVEPWQWALVPSRTFFSPDLRTKIII